ncbi:unnamed protein product [Brachionus calyciflorus]|uniref:Uncharacterized protein n=1 Tax=Brachionus calyciflorus TaxID=104777 RepID=A0A814KCK3_9BILA|nr:unnamed protein product [Brachionus calyciflorus]
MSKNLHKNYYEDCISDLIISDKLIDLDQLIIDYKTKPGCSSKLNICKLNSDKLKNEYSTFKHIWSNTIKCDCNDENNYYDGKKCLNQNTQTYTLKNSIYLLLQEKILQNENAIQI